MKKMKKIKKKKSIDELSLNKNVILNLNAKQINGGADNARFPILSMPCTVTVITALTRGNCIETIGDPGCSIETISWPG
jgi:hypothetical protein